MIILYVLLGLLGLILIVTAAEIIYYASLKPCQELPDKKDLENYSSLAAGKTFEDLYLYLSEEKALPSFSEEEIYNMLLIQTEYMNRRFDCSDFRAQLLFKIYKDCSEKLNGKCKELIKKTFLDFKYFMDEPGDDSMCYWSENHQIMFAVSEYLAGQEWQDEVFTNNGMTGKEHMEKAKKRIEAWMKQRFDYGFSEYLSNNYLAEDISPMANYIAYSKDKKSVIRMKIIMDILWLDVALNSVNNRFAATSSRMYGNNKAGNFYGNSIAAAMNILWGRDGAERILSDSYLSRKEKELIMESLKKEPNHILLCFTDIVRKGIYTLPEAIKDIALSKESFVSKMSCGLSPYEMEKEGLIGQMPAQIMAQWGAEVFTNPEAIKNTLEYVRKNKMYLNSFIGYFKFLNVTLLKFINWRKFAEKVNIMPHGISTGRGNIYTYRASGYLMSTSVCKDVDMCGAQEHIWSADIGENLTVFTTHPAGNGNGRYGSSPGYWIGNGRRPHSVQQENVNITIYKLPKKKRIGETGIAKLTHIYMPKEFYDEFELCGNIVFARKNGVFVAVISNGELKFRDFNEDSARGLMKNRIFREELMLKDKFDLCRYGGEYHIYITELSDSLHETFECFRQRIKNNIAEFSEDGRVEYITHCGKLTSSYAGEWSFNGIAYEKEFRRYDSKFCKAERKPESILVNSGKNSLFLDYDNAERMKKQLF